MLWFNRDVMSQTISWLGAVTSWSLAIAARLSSNQRCLWDVTTTAVQFERTDLTCCQSSLLTFTKKANKCLSQNAELLLKAPQCRHFLGIRFRLDRLINVTQKLPHGISMDSRLYGVLVPVLW